MYLFVSGGVSPSSPSPVTQQMTAMSISHDSGAVDSDRAEAEEEGEEEGTSNSSGKHHRTRRPFLSESVPTHYSREVSHTRSCGGPAC